MASTKLESSPKRSINAEAVFELTIAGLLWGFGFIGTVWALRSIDPSAILFYRFSIAFVGGFAFLLVTRLPKAIVLNEFRISLIPGVMLFLSLIFQTGGLQYTTATNSTFITSLYVVLVPILRAFSHEERLHWLHWVCVVIALIGTSFIVQIQNVSVLNWGDLLTLLCALFAALHIMVVGQRAMATKNDFAFNTFQSFWVALFALASFPLTERWNLKGMDTKGWIGILVLGFGASMIAFFLQVRSQKKISPSVASLLFLLESPASCFFAFWLLDEKMNSLQWTGAGMILFACILISQTKSHPPHYI